MCVQWISCVPLCKPMDCSPSGLSVHRISQARILEWVAISSSKGFSWPRDWTCNSFNGRQMLYHWATWEALSRKWYKQFNFYVKHKKVHIVAILKLWIRCFLSKQLLLRASYIPFFSNASCIKFSIFKT